jgi:hypothetical protein
MAIIYAKLLEGRVYGINEDLIARLNNSEAFV